MRRFFFALTMLIALQSQAQTTEDSIRAAVNTMFDAMRQADTARLRSVFSSSIIFQTVAVNRENVVSIRSEDPAAFIHYLGQQQPGLLDERIEFKSILVDGPLASVWTPYSFYAGGKFSHSGVNSFQLVRFPGGWKIQYIIDTRRR